MSTIPQNQAVLEGKLVLTNTENTNTTGNSGTNGVKYYDIFGQESWKTLNTGGDLRTSKNSIKYQVYRAPVSPRIILKQGNEEVTSIISVNQAANVSTVVEVISTHPVSISKKLSTKYLSNNIEGFSTREVTSDTNRTNYSYTFTVGQPRVESDGNYHYFLTVTPTSRNPSNTEPIKLGDLTFTSRIYKNGTKPTEWIVVDDDGNGENILKTILRTDTLNIINLNEDLLDNNNQSFRVEYLPDIDNAVPGVVYRGTMDNVSSSVYYPDGYNNGNTGTTYKFFVAVPYGLTKESYETGDIDYIESYNRYYYSQSEIDDTFGYVSKNVSVIQSGTFTYYIYGNKTEDIDFLGEGRNYELRVTTPEGTVSGYTVGTTENCTITTNGNAITMSVPSRISDYSPKPITNNYYTNLVSRLPVSFNLAVNVVETKAANKISNLGQLNSVIKSILELDGVPVVGTSGLNIEPSNIYYTDNITGLVKYVRLLETYDYYPGSSRHDVIGEAIQGYTHKTATWSLSNVSDLNKLIQDRNRKYGFPESEWWCPVIMSDSETSLQLPSNSDDFALVGGRWAPALVEDTDNDIIVDRFPEIAKRGYTYKVGSTRRTCTFPKQNNIRVRSANATWINSGNNEQLYNDLGLGYNGYAWETDSRITPILGSVDLTPIYTKSPTADSRSYGTTHYLWNYSIEQPQSGSIVQVSSLPITRNLCDLNTVYQVTGQQIGGYYWLNPEVRICKMKPVYSMVALSNPPEEYDDSHTYSKGDKVINDGEVYESLIDNNLGNDVSDTTKWNRLGDIYDASNLGYAYYKVDRLPNSSDIYTGGSVPDANQEGSKKYAKITNGGNISYYRKGYNFLDPDPEPFYRFYVSGVNQLNIDDVYTNNGLTFTIKEINITEGSGNIRCTYTAGSGTPEASGTLTKSSGDGDATITYTSVDHVKDYGLYVSDVTDPDHPVNTIKAGRFFTKVVNDEETIYFQFKLFAPELAMPNNFYDNTENKLLSSDYPGTIVLKGDNSESGFGRSRSQLESWGYYFVDFNDYTVRSQSFEETIDLRQERITKGIVSNLGSLNSSGELDSPGDYKLYLGESGLNTIEVSVDSGVTEIKGMIGVYDINNTQLPTSNRVGTAPTITVLGSRGTDVFSGLTTPRLDGGNTANFVVNFDKNVGDSAITRTYQFSYSEDELNTLVTLIITQAADPGEVRLSSRKLYFLSNGLLNNSNNFGILNFSSDIRNNGQVMDIDNIEVISNTGEDLIDRDGSLIEYTSLSPTYVTYRALLKLKPNTKHHNLEGFRIKIGKRTANGLTDRTLLFRTNQEIPDGFYKRTSSGWTLLGDDYIPTYLENYYEDLPETGTLGSVICKCSSLRGNQGYYSVSLFNPGVTNYSNPVSLEWRTTTDLQDIIDDFGLPSYFTPGDISGIITTATEIPDIETVKISGLIYQIGTTYYYTYSDFITSDYTYGTRGFPVAIGTGRQGQQKYHMEIVQSEYDTSGNTHLTNLTGTFFDVATNYDLGSTRWELYNTSGAPIEDINPVEVCFVRAVYSDTQNPSLVPYLETSYSFSDNASDIIIKSEVHLKVHYNNSGNIPMDGEYLQIDNLFTLYTERKWNNS